MKTRTYLLGSLAAIVVVPPSPSSADPLGTAFTYQGRLDQGGSPVDGTADFEFTLWDADLGANLVGAPVAISAVDIADGLFTVEIDFGMMAFNGDARWLQLAVRLPSGAGMFTTLSPRQPLTAAPYALFAVDAPGGGVGDGHSLDAADGDPVDVVFVDENARVGVGTDPLLKLDVRGGNLGTDGDLLLTGPNPELRSTLQSGRMKFIDGSHIVVNATNTSDGFFGIHTSTPQQPLDVAGIIRSSDGGFMFPDGTVQTTATSADGQEFWSDNGANISNTNTGNVGIGITTPAEKLHVAGNIATGGAILLTGSNPALLSTLHGGRIGFVDGNHLILNPISTGVSGALEAALTRMIETSNGGKP